MAKWVSDCFIYTNLANQLNYLISSQTHTMTLGNNTGNPAGTDRPTWTLSHVGAIPDLLREGMRWDYRVLCRTGVCGG